MITYSSIASMKLNRYILDYNNQLNSINTQLKTGSSINKASDSPAMFNFTAKVKGYAELYGVANENATSGIAMVDIAQESLEKMQDKLSAIKAIIETCEGTTPSAKRKEYQAQINSLIKDIYEIKYNTEFNGLQIFEQIGVTPSAASGAAGASASEQITPSPYIDEVETRSDEELENEGYVVVHNAAELIQAFNDDSFAAIALGADIDLSGVNWTPLGDESNPFYGELEGNGYKIKNLTINTTQERSGLIGYAENAYFSNVAIENVDVRGTYYVGALLGYGSGVEIINSYVKDGNVQGIQSVGGLVGRLSNSNVDASYAELDLVSIQNNNAGGFVGGLYSTTITRSYADATVTGSSCLGGFSGEINTSSISDSYAIGSVQGNLIVGGFAARTGSTSITNSYSASEVSGNGSVGGFIGEFVGSSALQYVENSFFNTETSGQTDGIGLYISSSSTQTETLFAVTTSEMYTPSTFTDVGWDTNTWSLSDEDFPFLHEPLDLPFQDKPDPPVYYGPLKQVNGAIRVQTGNDNTDNSCVMVNTAFAFDDYFNFDVSKKSYASISMSNLETVQAQLSQKAYDLSLSRKQLVSQANSTATKSKNGYDVYNALTGVDEDELNAQKTQLLSDIANAKSLRDSLLEFNAQMCQTLIIGAIQSTRNNSSNLFDANSWLAGLLQ